MALLGSFSIQVIIIHVNCYTCNLAESPRLKGLTDVFFTLLVVSIHDFNVSRCVLSLKYTLCRLEGIPVMDGAVGVRGLNVKDPGTDAFCSLSFGGNKPFRSKVKTVKGTSRLAMNPTFNCDLWYPVSIPTMVQVSYSCNLDST